MYRKLFKLKPTTIIKYSLLINGYVQYFILLYLEVKLVALKLKSTSSHNSQYYNLLLVLFTTQFITM